MQKLLWGTLQKHSTTAASLLFERYTFNGTEWSEHSCLATSSHPQHVSPSERLELSHTLVHKLHTNLKAELTIMYSEQNK